MISNNKLVFFKRFANTVVFLKIGVGIFKLSGNLSNAFRAIFASFKSKYDINQKKLR